MPKLLVTSSLIENGLEISEDSYDISSGGSQDPLSFIWSGSIVYNNPYGFEPSWPSDEDSTSMTPQAPKT